ncbi:MAG: hypothetical protein WBZ33_09090 [Thermoactinomyces sp.]
MQIFHFVIVILFILLGIYQMFMGDMPVLGVHYLLIAFYFFITYQEWRGQPFSRLIYWIAMCLLTADGIANLFFYSYSLISGIISLVFAFLVWKSSQRLTG